MNHYEIILKVYSKAPPIELAQYTANIEKVFPDTQLAYLKVSEETKGESDGLQSAN